MILVIDNDLIMAVDDPTRDYKSRSMGLETDTVLRHRESEFLGRSSYPVAEFESEGKQKQEGAIERNFRGIS